MSVTPITRARTSTPPAVGTAQRRQDSQDQRFPGRHREPTAGVHLAEHPVDQPVADRAAHPLQGGVPSGLIPELCQPCQASLPAVRFVHLEGLLDHARRTDVSNQWLSAGSSSEMVDGSPAWGRLDGDAVSLDGGKRIPIADAAFLAPVEPTKIIATHLTYRSRVDEYGARVPPEPSYFMKPPTTLNGHHGLLRRPRGARFLNYEGEVAVVVGRPIARCTEDGCSTTWAGSPPPTTSGSTTSATPTAARCCGSRAWTGSARSGRGWCGARVRSRRPSAPHVRQRHGRAGGRRE